MNKGDRVILAIATFILCLGAVVWWRAQDLGLLFWTAGEIVSRLVLLDVALVSVALLGVRLTDIWPCGLGGLWWSLLPALDDWAADSAQEALELQGVSPSVALRWWNTWYVEVGVMVLLIVLGYVLKAIYQARKEAEAKDEAK